MHSMFGTDPEQPVPWKMNSAVQEEELETVDGDIDVAGSISESEAEAEVRARA